MSEYPAEYVHALRDESEQRREAIERAIAALEEVLRELRLALVSHRPPDEPS